MSGLARLFDNTTAYRLIQAPFAEDKLAPVWRHVDPARVRRVLDVGCGPGTNAAHFAHADYLGVDVNPAYIRHARGRFPGRFAVVDVVRDPLPPGAHDFVLLNSLLHHLDDAAVARLLEALRGTVAPDGRLHVLDLVLPRERGIARALARMDRGDHPREEAHWLRLLGAAYEPVVFERYPLRFLGATLWNMFYFQGKARR
jgi:SAM-dependent methyltransferase